MPVPPDLRHDKPDPIEDVRRCFEAAYTQDYWHPYSGDWLSDDYERVIDLTTQPDCLSLDEIGKLNRSIQRLNQRSEYIQKRLGGWGLTSVYESVVEQINLINSTNPNCHGIIPMFEIPADVEAI